MTRGGEPVYNGAILFNHTRINRMNTPEHLLKFEWYEKHQEWLIDSGAGSRANLRDANLCVQPLDRQFWERLYLHVLPELY